LLSNYISMSDTSAIDDKTTSDTSNSDSNWGTFGMLVFRYFILSILFVFVGINYIFLLNYKQIRYIVSNGNAKLYTNTTKWRSVVCKLSF